MLADLIALSSSLVSYDLLRPCDSLRFSSARAASTSSDMCAAESPAPTLDPRRLVLWSLALGCMSEAKGRITMQMENRGV